MIFAHRIAMQTDRTHLYELLLLSNRLYTIPTAGWGAYNIGVLYRLMCENNYGNNSFISNICRILSDLDGTKLEYFRLDVAPIFVEKNIPDTLLCSAITFHEEDMADNFCDEYVGVLRDACRIYYSRNVENKHIYGLSLEEASRILKEHEDGVILLDVDEEINLKEYLIRVAKVLRKYSVFPLRITIKETLGGIHVYIFLKKPVSVDTKLSLHLELNDDYKRIIHVMSYKYFNEKIVVGDSYILSIYKLQLINNTWYETLEYSLLLDYVFINNDIDDFEAIISGFKTQHLSGTK